MDVRLNTMKTLVSVRPSLEKLEHGFKFPIEIRKFSPTILFHILIGAATFLLRFFPQHIRVMLKNKFQKVKKMVSKNKRNRGVCMNAM